MDFHDIKKIESPEFYIDKAFRQTARETKKLRLRGKTPLDKVKYKEMKKLDFIEESLCNDINKIVSSFPSFHKLPLFYQELININIGLTNLKKALATLTWIKNKIKELKTKLKAKMKEAKDFRKINSVRKEFYGRVNSLFKRKADTFRFLESARRTMETFPTLKTKMPVVCICGYPNVGKSTLLKNLCGSKVEIKPYPFTTQRLLLGKIKQGNKKIQVIDTPGLFDRPLKERNKMELQSILALKYITSVIVFIIDPSEACGYSLENQLSLLKEVSVKFKKPILVIVNKIDITPEKNLQTAREGVKEFRNIETSVNNEENIPQIKKEIFKLLRSLKK